MDNKIGVIGEYDSIYGFAALGLTTFPVTDSESAVKALKNMAANGYGIIYITESMDILGKVTSNEIYREIMINTINCIGRGEKISVAFKDNWAIPEVAYYMMVTGESTGQLSEMMEKVSEYYAEQHKLIVNTLKTYSYVRKNIKSSFHKRSIQQCVIRLRSKQHNDT